MTHATSYAAARLRALLPHPRPDANKYTRGKLVLIAGSAAYPGAAALASRAASRMGAGYVECVCDPASASVVRMLHPSAVVRPWDTWDAGLMPPMRQERPSACVIGPGIDCAEERPARLLLDVLARVSAPVLVDGGALSHLATDEGIRAARDRAARGWQTALTPHAGEAARLARAAGLASLEDGAHLADPAGYAADLARAFAAMVVLKGPDTYVAPADARDVVVVTCGTSALAKAGTGDVLAGMIGALLAQGLSPLDAAVLGATVHAGAARAAAFSLTDICVMPEDVVEAIPRAVVNLDRA